MSCLILREMCLISVGLQVMFTAVIIGALVDL